MNAMARSLGLGHTHIVEPSGIADGDLGRAVDMMHLGADALANPTIAGIVALGEVVLPVAGTVLNYDYEVGHHGIIGIKTGSSSAAGGNFVFAARRTVDGRTLTVVGAVLGQQGVSRLQTALDTGVRLAAAALSSVRELTIARAGLRVVVVRAELVVAAGDGHHHRRPCEPSVFRADGRRSAPGCRPRSRAGTWRRSRAASRSRHVTTRRARSTATGFRWWPAPGPAGPDAPLPAGHDPDRRDPYRRDPYRRARDRSRPGSRGRAVRIYR